MQKGTFCKIFRSKQNFLELQCLIDDLVNILELSMFINTFFTLNILFDEVDKGLRHEKKQTWLFTIYIVFFLKLLQMT